MKIDCDDGLEPSEYQTVLEALVDNRVLSIKLEENGLFRLREECDGFFLVRLTPEQLIALGNEIILTGFCAQKERAKP
jgi:hypothetical protein